MSYRLINNISVQYGIKNAIFIGAKRGLSIHNGETLSFNYNTVYYFDKVIREKFLNITTTETSATKFLSDVNRVSNETIRLVNDNPEVDTLWH